MGIFSLCLHLTADYINVKIGSRHFHPFFDVQHLFEIAYADAKER